MKEHDLTPIPQNYKNSIDWIIGTYQDSGVSFPNGFQKDVIQNAVGAREKQSWKGWSCDISVIKSPNGKQYLVIEDKGTLGLIGRNITSNEINTIMASGKTLPASERLSRFTSMHNSGGNDTGGGLYGVGKIVYSAASETYTYYFDSLTIDGKYVANGNIEGRVHSPAYENNDAKNFILKETGFKEKTTVGTRIIIDSPKQSLIEAINDGSMIKNIQESWWRIIKRFDSDSKISVNGKSINIPNNIEKTFHKWELSDTDKYSDGYKVKHFGLYIYESESPWKGISYYRKGMKIGEIEIKDCPKNIENKFWGYIEVDEKWENELAEIEDKIHFGVSKGKKQTSQYQYLKNYCNETFRKCLIEWGYIKDKENEDKKLQEELKQIADDIQNLSDRLGFEDLGTGPKKSDFDVRWQNIQYPVQNSLRVTTGDNIKFSIRIKSSYIADKKFNYKLYVINPQTGETISNIKNESITINSGTVYTSDFIHNIDNESSQQFAENRIILEVNIPGSGKKKKKELQYFYDIDRPENNRDTVTLSLHECKFPRANSRRVNFEESITDVCYYIENKRNQKLNYKLNISIHNADAISKDKIIDINSISGTIEPFGEIVTSKIDIKFEESFYQKFMASGILELRARLIANEADEIYEKGEKITKYEYKIYLNCDEKNGKNNSFNINSVKAPENHRRSWCEPGRDRSITINIGHAAYLKNSYDQELQHDYLREQMLKQYVILYLKEGRFDMFKEGSSEWKNMEPQDAAEQVIEKIERVYYESLQ